MSPYSLEARTRQARANLSKNQAAEIRSPGMSNTPGSRPRHRMIQTTPFERTMPDGLDLHQALLTADAFEPGSEAATSALAELADSLAIWCGAETRLDVTVPFETAPEVRWWPRRFGQRGSRHAGDPTIRVSFAPAGQFDLGPGLVVAAAWASPAAVRRLLGLFGPVAESARRAEGTARAMAIRAMARADLLPAMGPTWWLRRGDETLLHDVAFDRLGDNALDLLTWDDLVAEVEQHDLGEEGSGVSIFLLWHFPAVELVGAPLQVVTEALASAFVFSRIAAEETMRPFARPAPILRDARRGAAVVESLRGYPSGWEADPGDPVEVIERDLIRCLVEPEAVGSNSALVAAHATGWRRLPGVGVAGVVELLRSWSGR